MYLAVWIKHARLKEGEINEAGHSSKIYDCYGSLRLR